MVSIFLPRKGTETLDGDSKLEENTTVSIFLPRKGTETGPNFNPCEFMLVSIFLPRKGTETRCVTSLKHTSSFNFFTPQGDGNMGVLDK